ncbi:hypothetical protein ABZ726_00680 [Streptomyces hundungensis]|uniref:hypothetical protein n=1 Tax=Streptomyces hundungensis TaxID=1077946 RepID=UPI0033DA557B
MRLRTAWTAVAAVSGALLLTACGPSAPAAKRAPAAASPTHPVFSKPLDDRPYAALGQTKAAKNVTFTQTVTFSAKEGDAVLKTSGKLDFAGGRADGSLGWSVAEGFPDGAAKALGTVDAHRRQDGRTARLVIGPQNLDYRSATADYWLRYSGTTPLAADPHGYALLAANALRGNQAPFSGTLLEVLAATADVNDEALPDGGHRYRAFLVGSSISGFLAGTVPAGGLAGTVNNVRHPLTMTVDRDGRITSAETDVSQAIAKGDDSVLAPVQNLRIKLTLDGYGTSAPGAVPASDKLLPATGAIVRLRETKAGACVDFHTGMTDTALVVKADCERPHDGRILARPELPDGGYPGHAAAQRQAARECRAAYRDAPSAWTGENVDEKKFWYTTPGEDDWKGDAPPAATCYVLSR